MKDLIVAFLFYGLLGLIGAAVSIWLVVTGNATASVDNLFLTLVGVLFALVGLGYNTWLVRSLLARSERAKKDVEGKSAGSKSETGRSLARAA